MTRSRARGRRLPPGYVGERDEKAVLKTAIKQFKIGPAEQNRLIVLRRN